MDDLIKFRSSSGYIGLNSVCLHIGVGIYEQIYRGSPSDCKSVRKIFHPPLAEADPAKPYIYLFYCPRSPTARVHVAVGGNIIRKLFLIMAKCRGDGREPSQRVHRAVAAVLWCWARDVYALPSTTPGALLPPLKAPALPPREAYQGILGYKTTQYTTTWLIARLETGFITS